MFTVITMYRGHDAALFVNVVEGRLTTEQRQRWRDAMNCDQPDDEDNDGASNMFFREFETMLKNEGTVDMFNADDADIRSPLRQGNHSGTSLNNRDSIAGT